MGSARRLLLVAAVCLAVLSALGGAARTATLEELVSPGPVIRAHAEFESECDSCHAPFARKEEDELCLACHEDVGTDRSNATGFHGRAPEARNSLCRSCHSEHVGREADVVGLDAGTFDHEHTDYPLRGAHLRTACGKCHAAGELHRDSPSDCVSCHRAEDPHRERLGEACGDCHTEKAWREARFDHEATGFALRGGHEEVACALCHADERYAETPEDCASCHRLDDVHAGEFGAACEGCHDVSAWSAPRFDHDRETGFPLLGGHRGIRCDLCHAGKLFEEKVATDCISCHRADDVHRGAHANECGKCHEAAAWADRKFDHDRDTGFVLAGAHREARCQACHEGVLYESETPSDCAACHAKDDVHAGQLGSACRTCHVEAGWASSIVFDHQLGRFPLLGLHAAVACEECHASYAFEDADLDCLACHPSDDAHGRRLGTECATCHNPNGWSRWRFDHGAQTTFALHGAHEGADCLSCHREPVRGEIELSKGCADCHAQQDVHDGGFGRDCRRCHTEEAWSHVLLPR